jgi:hypothetical protein
MTMADRRAPAFSFQHSLRASYLLMPAAWDDGAPAESMRTVASAAIAIRPIIASLQDDDPDSARSVCQIDDEVGPRADRTGAAAPRRSGGRIAHDAGVAG